MKNNPLFKIVTSIIMLSCSILSSSKAQVITKMLWDVKELSIPPKFEFEKGGNEVKALKFKGVDYKGKATQVFAYYSNPNLVHQTTNTQNKFPGVVLIHGGGGKAYKEWVKKWALSGYAAIAIDLTGKGEDGKVIANAGPPMGDSTIFYSIQNSQLKDMWTYHSVASAVLAHSLLRSFTEVDTSRTAITGISWGGYLTDIVIGIDQRFKAAVPVYGCGYYAETSIFKQKLNLLTAEDRKTWIKNFDPSAYMANANTKILFLNGNKDKFFSVIPYAKTYNLVKENNRYIAIVPDMKHGHNYGWDPVEVKMFIDDALANKNSYPKVVSTKYKDGVLTAAYQSSAPLVMAELYYSNDSGDNNENRIWQVRKVMINGDKTSVEANLSPKEFKYAFFYMRNLTGISFSSEYIFQDTLL